MKCRILAAVLGCWFAMTPAVSMAAAAPIADIKQLVKDGQYSEALKRISEALASPKADHQYDLYMLRGECHLQSKAVTLAADAYDHAARQTQEQDPKAIALAHALLMKKSAGLAYRPTTGDQKGQPIDIIKLESRKQAFAALLADQEATYKTKLQQAQSSKKLPPILDVADDAVVMLGLELSAKGSATTTRSTLQAILSHAKTLVTQSLNDMDKDVDRIDRDANGSREFTQDKREVVGKTVQIRKVKVWQKNGLSKAEASQLQDYAATCDKIGPAVQMLSQGIKSEQKDLSGLVTQANKIRKQIERLQNEDFSRVYHQKPK